MIVNVGKNISEEILERRREACRRWYYAHREERIKKMRKYLASHREENKEYCRRYYRLHKLEIIRKNLEFQRGHRDLYRQYHKKYYWQNREREAERKRKEYLENEEYRRRITEGSIGKYRRLRLAVIKLLGGKCIACGEDDPMVLQINHKNGGGGKEYTKISNKRYLKTILSGKRNLNDLDLRCANCNFRYEYERGRVGRCDTPYKRYYNRLKNKVIDLLGGKCVNCGTTDRLVLQVNHKNGKGRKREEHSSSLYRDIVKGRRKTDDLDLRCANCNLLYNRRVVK